MMKALVVTALCLASSACDPVFSLRARVRNPAGLPLADAALALTCGEPTSSWPGKAALTDAEGRAEVGRAGRQAPGALRDHPRAAGVSYPPRDVRGAVRAALPRRL